MLREREVALFPPGFLRSSGAHSLVSISLPPAAVDRAAAAIAGRMDALRIQEGFELRSLKGSPMAGVFQSLVASLDALLPLGEGLVGQLVTDDVLLRAVAVVLDPSLVTREPADPLRPRDHQARADFDALIDFIRANLHQPLRLSDLEAQSQWSRWAVQEAFRQRLKATPMEWIREQRLQRAMEHLQRAQEPLPLGELALHCGYQRLSHFSRDFKKRFGIPPSQVRRL
ncbi:MAG: helix-turn-helix transcriptional regulator [Cyanobium sp.]